MMKIVDKQLDDLLRCVPVKVKRVDKETLRKRVSRALLDTKRVYFDCQTYKWDATLIRRLATLRRHLFDVRVLLRDNPGLVALLNVQADLCAKDSSFRFELIFRPRSRTRPLRERTAPCCYVEISY